MICTPHQILLGWSTREKCDGRGNRSYGRQKWCVQDFVWEIREKELLGRLVRKWEDNIKIHLQEVR